MKNVFLRVNLAYCCLVALLLTGQYAQAGDEIYKAWFSNKALSGFDAVAYFTEQRPVKGKDAYTVEYKGADWHFSSEKNLQLFRDAPEKYAPQYGGHCAWAAAQGKLVKGDPLHWEVHGDKLYLNYNADVHKKWKADKESLVAKADKFWAREIK